MKKNHFIFKNSENFNIASEASYVYLNEAYFAHVISQCVQFVIVLSRDRNLGRVNELTGYDKSRVSNPQFLKKSNANIDQYTCHKLQECDHIRLQLPLEKTQLVPKIQ